MKINLFLPKCRTCGGDTRKIKIFDAKGNILSRGTRCLKCNRLERNFIHDIKMEDPCCQKMQKEFNMDGEGIKAHYNSESGRLWWDIEAEEYNSFDIFYCPFCGSILPTMANSIPI